MGASLLKNATDAIGMVSSLTSLPNIAQSLKTLCQFHLSTNSSVNLHSDHNLLL
jgi:hypothetical protein